MQLRIKAEEQQTVKLNELRQWQSLFQEARAHDDKPVHKVTLARQF